MEKIVEERRRELEKVLSEARTIAKCLSKLFSKLVVILYGSYARGDFNEWSDLDVLTVVEAELPKNPVERLNYVDECIRISPRLELTILTIEELRRLYMKRNPIVIEAVEKGIVLLNTFKKNLKDLVKP